MTLLRHATTVLAVALPLTSASPPTKIHEPGRCAIRGHCGKQGFFGSDLPCPDNGKASTPTSELRQSLVDLCGPKWNEGDVCCEQEQVDALRTNLKRAEGIIASCPACKDNFFNLFCTFTCSPDQSLFINVTQTETTSAGKDIVTELDNIWSTEYQSGFYDSCKEVKNGASGGKAMSFIGGGAKNYTQFLKFLGDKKFLGSPFQINFLEEPRHEDKNARPLDITPHACNDTDPNFRCSCVDCPAVCPTLPEVKDVEYCHVGVVPCLSFAIIIVYSVALFLLVTAVVGHVAWIKHKKRESERLRLLHDAAASDDEDDEGYVRNAGVLDRPYRKYYLNQIFDRAFSKLGSFCARFPGLTIGTNVLIIGLLSLGWLKFEVELDPVRLWVSPDSDAAQEKAFFDANFGPFYRTEQMFVVNDTEGGEVLNRANLDWLFGVEEKVAKISAGGDARLTLDDFCFKPTGDACVVQSLSGWFQGSLTDDWQATIEHCADSPGALECLPPYMDPLLPGRVLGGYHGVENVTHAKAMTITWVVNNHEQGSGADKITQIWEQALKDELLEFQKQASKRGLRMSFSTEISLEEELNKSTNTDAKIVAISYVVMFIYASLALGSGAVTLQSLFSHPSNAFVQSKFTLGVVGILIVLMSVSGSVGLFSAAGVKVTLIIAEVIPFLVLAVGVDNIFLIVHEFDRVNVSHPDEEIETRVAKALGRMGPSILLSASTETIAFAMGAFVGMPAVKNFAAYAAGAVFINAILQVTMFISILALNQRRVESLRADCFPCITVKRANSVNMPGGHLFGSDEEGALQRFIRRWYAPKLMDNKIKTIVVAIFITIFGTGLALLPEIALGLDQRIAIPADSYLINYFNDLYAYFGQGPPVYFVTRDVNATQRVSQQEICGQFTTCQDFSLPLILEQESKRPSVSYINSATASWIDDFFFWLNPNNENCCVNEDDSPCLADGEWNITLSGMPEGHEFIDYVSRWIQSPTTEECPLGGQAAYSDALVIDHNNTNIPASHFRTFHTPLQSQEDLIGSYAAARRIAREISDAQDIDVFPYSKHYIFFDQYSSIIRLTATLLCIAVAIIFVLSSLLLGSLLTGAVVAVTVIMILVDIIGVMAVAGVSLNAVSLVNLVICVGIGVEFCAHIARAFMFPAKAILDRGRNKFRGRDLRAWAALVNVGGSVFSGITITKFLGVAVLAFTRSKIFEVYYFRIWLALVILASSHALVFLPVALSLTGGNEGYVSGEGEGGLREDLGRRGRYRSLLGDGGMGDDEDSDEEGSVY
ncbi:Niemann-Pick type C-related protein 1 [Cyphellophora attinorum]|uniref:Niemann-Pick type C-related protein 1 n=1 Tax=Cyphellophora attinorum TaxID=1664694 RepID=A0A0N1HQI1_9EURO|nr:Niemann-Pick type C-related protein 1 [Phialophora attinorum]KPI40214.1 Niemann-Pick type C-related protein 1 [Phialophora attinorum]